MNREQATGILKKLTEVDRALRDAERAIAGLGKQDRLKFRALLANVFEALHENVLTELFK
jgi:hypothetical protein